MTNQAAEVAFDDITEQSIAENTWSANRGHTFDEGDEEEVAESSIKRPSTAALPTYGVQGGYSVLS